jgi:hypothetical protein
MELGVHILALTNGALSGLFLFLWFLRMPTEYKINKIEYKLEKSITKDQNIDWKFKFFILLLWRSILS